MDDGTLFPRSYPPDFLGADPVTWAAIKTAIQAEIPPGAAAWGGITGTLADQLDLDGALDALDAAITGKAAKAANLSDLASASTARTNLGLGTAALAATGDFATAAQGVDARTPLTHKTSHENGGADELSVAGLSGALADPQPPIIGGGAAQAVAGNDARLTDARTPLAHNTSHQNGGADEINVAGLSGALADPQPPIIGGGAAQAVAGNDARLTDARTPTAHKTSHQDGGADELALDASQVTTGQLAMARMASGTPDGTKYVADDGTLKAPTAALPDLVQTRLTTNGDKTVNAGYGAYVPDVYEIEAGNALEIGAGSLMEVG